MARLYPLDQRETQARYPFFRIFYLFTETVNIVFYVSMVFF